MTARWLPDGFHTITPNIIAEDGEQAVAFLKQADMFFGIREGRVADPFGNVWIIATLKERLAPEEMQRIAQNR